MLAVHRWRAVAQLMLVAVGVAAGAMGFSGWKRSSQELREIESHSRALAEQAVSFTIAGIEHAMLQGKGVMIKELIERYRSRVPDVDIHIYDNLGYEVFAELPPPPPRSSLPPELLRILDGGSRLRMNDGRMHRPIADEERCHACHKAGPLRGVLALTGQPAVLMANRATILPGIIRSAFTFVMTSRNAFMLDDFFTQLQTNAPTISAIGLYGNDAQLRFGGEVPDLVDADVRPSLVAGAEVRVLTRGGRSITLIPLPKEKRCTQCHDDVHPVRGVLVVALREVDADLAMEELESVVDGSIRVLMMSSLGRMIIKFLRGVADTGAVTNIAVYDAEGRNYFSPAPASPPATVRAMLADPAHAAGESRTGAGTVLITRSLANEGKCITCHGTDSPIRGIVTMSLSQRPGDHVQDAAIRSATMFTAIMVGGAVLVLLVVASVILGRRRRPTV